MTTTVHVSRTFKVDASDPEVLEELRILAARGFEVLGPISLTPVVTAVEPKPEKKSRASEIIYELHASGLRFAEIAALLGVSQSSVAAWKSVDGDPRLAASETRVRELEALLKRSRSLPQGSTALRDEARGAAAAQRRLAPSRQGRGRPLSDEQRLGIAVMKESGSKVDEISRAFGVNRRTVYKVLKDLEV